MRNPNPRLETICGSGHVIYGFPAGYEGGCPLYMEHPVDRHGKYRDQCCSPLYALVDPVWACVEKHPVPCACTWRQELMYEVTSCPLCGCDVEIVDPPAMAAAYRVGGWDAVRDIRNQTFRDKADEVAEALKTSAWFEARNG